jgi:hypothetical protein
MELFNIASIFLLITSIILIIYTMEREQEFLSYNDAIQNASVHGAAYAINLQLQDKNKHVRLFIDEYAKLIRHLERFPDDAITADSIKLRLQQRFADFFTYTITDPNGFPSIMDIDSLVGDACQRDLDDYVKKVGRSHGNILNEIFIHPQPYNYHYDIMAPLKDGDKQEGIFFTSFYLNEIVDILKTHEVPGQTLVLLRQSDPGLIELTRNGTRDRLKRDIRLSEDEKVRITAYENIPDTDWRLVNLPDEDFKSDYLTRLWKEVAVILVVVAVALYILVLALVRISEKNNR